MELLKERIIKDGTVVSGTVLKVDSFLNQAIDTKLVCELANEWKRLYSDDNVTKILTVESSGIGIAAITGSVFGVPVVFAKKTKNIVLKQESTQLNHMHLNKHNN